MHKSNQNIIHVCINAHTVNKYLIQRKTCINMLKFIQILKEIKKQQIARKKIKISLIKQLKKNRVNVGINKVQKTYNKFTKKNMEKNYLIVEINNFINN